MPTKKHESYSHVFTTRREPNNIIHRGSVIVSGKESERFLEDLLIADDKSNNTRNKYLWITTRMPLLIFLALKREMTSRERHCFHLCLYRFVLIVGVNADLITNLTYILLRHIMQYDYDWCLREMKDRMGANWERCVDLTEDYNNLDTTKFCFSLLKVSDDVAHRFCRMNFIVFYLCK